MCINYVGYNSTCFWWTEESPLLMQDLLWPFKAFEHGIEVDIIHITHTHILFLNAIPKSNSYPVAREGLWEGGKKIRIAYSTEYSQVVTHPSTNSAQSCLTAVLRRELVCSTWYGCRHLKCAEKLFFKRTFLHMPLG